MNKICKIALLFLVLIVVSGCDKENTLNCKKESGNINHHIKIEFNENKAPIATYKEEYTYANDDAYIDMKLLELKEQYSVFDGEEGINYSLKQKKDSLILNFKIDHNLYENNIANIPVLVDTLENNKANLENNGYTCK